MLGTLLNYSRPVRISDGRGGFTESVSSTPLQVWADPIVQDGKEALLVRADEDVKTGDLFEVPDNLFISA